MDIIRPDFCTTVSPDEYDYIEQFNDAMKAANKFHAKFVIDEKCPPPYYPVDMGKVYGLLSRIAALEERLAEAEAIIKQAHERIGYLSDGFAPDVEPETLVTTWQSDLSAFLAGGDTNKV